MQETKCSPMPAPPHEFLTEFEVAERWRIEPKTLRNRRRDLVGPVYTKIGGAVRYAWADVIEFERTHKWCSTSKPLRDA